MDQLKIRGGNQLNGEIKVGGAKNAALPILFASLLTDEPVFFHRVPQLKDVEFTLKVLEHLGVSCEFISQENKVRISSKSIQHFDAPYDLVRKMRASVLALGPLLARHGHAKVSLPGGCAIGARPIDLHLKGLKAMGAQIELQEGYVNARSKRLNGVRFRLNFPSVGATENLIMAASLAKGETRLENCAQEPEITNLAECLISMGAEISGAGTSTIEIQGKEQLKGTEFEVIGDRVQAGTYLIAAFATQGNVTVKGIKTEYLESLLEALEASGATIKRREDEIELKSHARPRAVSIETSPFPGFPTDMQAQWMALMSRAEGESKVIETIFENRFMHVSELTRMGAQIRTRGNIASIKGQNKLKGAPVMATDLRASASLIVAGLCAEGETVINRIYHLDRGYELIEKHLSVLGGDIERVKSPV